MRERPAINSLSSSCLSSPTIRDLPLQRPILRRRPSLVFPMLLSLVYPSFCLFFVDHGWVVYPCLSPCSLASFVPLSITLLFSITSTPSITVICLASVIVVVFSPLASGLFIIKCVKCIVSLSGISYSFVCSFFVSFLSFDFAGLSLLFL